MITTVYLDLDGVFADFEGKILEVSGKHLSELSSQEMWDIIRYENLKYPFFENLAVLRESLEILEFLKTCNVDVEILSARGTRDVDGSYLYQKTSWVRKNLGDYVVNCVERGAEKGNYYAKPCALLIDDMPRNINNFVEHGGHGIVFVNAQQTIEDLRRIIKEN